MTIFALTTDEVVARLQGDWAKDIASYEKIHGQILAMADMLSSGIINQFPADRQSQIRIMLSESLKGVVAQVLCKKIGGGRVAVREILISIPAIANLIREGKTFQIPSMMQTQKKLGCILLNDSLLDFVEKKVV